MDLSKKIADWIKTQVDKAGKKGIVFGLSGGIDSAVLGAISRQALGNNVLGLILPCKNAAEDVKLAQKVAKKLNIEAKEVALDNIFDELARISQDATTLAKGNLKARLRMAVLYYFANDMNYLVAGAGNKSEITIGYFTKYGDGGVDILPLGGLLKTEVKELAKRFGIPEEIINRPPSAGLWEGQTDEAEICITYDKLDKTIAAIEKNKTEDIDKSTLFKVKEMIANTEHKRAKIPTFGVIR